MTPPPTRCAGHDLVHAVGLHGCHNVPGALGHHGSGTLEGTESGCHWWAVAEVVEVAEVAAGVAEVGPGVGAAPQAEAEGGGAVGRGGAQY